MYHSNLACVYCILLIQYFGVILIIATAPTSYPTLHSVTSISPSIVNLTWNEVDCSEQNGMIVGYAVQYYVGTEIDSFWLDYPTSSYYIIRELTPGKVYTYKVAAANKVGFGPYSPWTQFTVPR